MYLTKITMPIRERAVRNAIADAQAMHRMLCGLFEKSRADAKLLYRTNEIGRHIVVYMYSEEPINRSKLLPFMLFEGEREISDVINSVDCETVLRYDVIVSPSKKVAREGDRLSRRTGLKDAKKRSEWLTKRFAEGGCDLLNVLELEKSTIGFVHNNDHVGRGSAYTYHYTGTIRVRNAKQFAEMMSTGIGPYKAYGCGMIMIRA